jgi:hypothetical protein
LDRSQVPADLAERQQPHVLAEFAGVDLPFVVERQVGAGRIVLVTSGVTSDWNLLRVSGAMYLFHRMFSDLLEETLPVRNFEAGQRITLPVHRQSDVRYELTRPSGRQETVPLEALTADAFGVQIRAPIMAGAYRIDARQETVVAEPPDEKVAVRTANRSHTPSESGPSSQLDEWVFAVNGPAAESDLTRISPEELAEQIQRDDVRILGVNEPIDVRGDARRGQGLWQTFLIGVLIVLFCEMLLLAWPTMGQKEAA